MKREYPLNETYQDLSQFAHEQANTPAQVDVETPTQDGADAPTQDDADAPAQGGMEMGW